MDEANEEPFELTYDDEPTRVIRGVVRRPTGEPRGAVLVLHGFKGFMHWGFFPEARRRLADAGFVAVAFNTSGSGIGPDLESFSDEAAFARNTFSRELEDIARVREHVGGRAARWGLLGHSRGGGMALVHAAERGDYRAVVTWSAISTTHRFPPDVLDAWRRDGFLLIKNARTGQELRLGVECLEDVEQHPERLDIAAACGRLTSPTLLVHGRADEAVPFAESDRLLAAFRPGCARRLAVDGAGHTFGAVHPWAGTTPALEEVLAATLEHLSVHLE